MRYVGERVKFAGGVLVGGVKCVKYQLETSMMSFPCTAGNQ